MRLKSLLLASLIFLTSTCFADDIINGSKVSNIEIEQYRGVKEPAVSPASQARAYYNVTQQKVMLSVNGGAYAAIGSGGGFTNGSDITTGNLTVNHTIYTPIPTELTLMPGNGIVNCSNASNSSIATPAGSPLTIIPGNGVVNITNGTFTGFNLSNGATVRNDAVGQFNISGANISLPTSGIAAPSTNSFLIPVSTSTYGINTTLMGVPTTWFSIWVNGTNYKVPAY